MYLLSNMAILGIYVRFQGYTVFDVYTLNTNMEAKPAKHDGS